MSSVILSKMKFLGTVSSNRCLTAWVWGTKLAVSEGFGVPRKRHSAEDVLRLLVEI